MTGIKTLKMTVAANISKMYSDRKRYLTDFCFNLNSRKATPATKYNKRSVSKAFTKTIVILSDVAPKITITNMISEMFEIPFIAKVSNPFINREFCIR